MSDAHQVTLLLARWAEGSQQALEELTPLVYQELRQLRLLTYEEKDSVTRCNVRR